MVLGNSPENWFWLMSRISRAVMFPISGGIVPLSLLSESSSTILQFGQIADLFWDRAGEIGLAEAQASELSELADLLGDLPG
ncbi:hypothetical protein C4D60_Mb03t02280 [Musa balbisiana]|uniref:Uncharacterized protein n=1 Tax=Musa balbisiana TaxID=52838 RepID=A0A4S8J724_MUSBA|nr:hypothetical protein C4D60_Mb03t02280 [Musa balbisiana]